MQDIKWTAAEKKIARRVFAAALQREYADIIARLKALAAQADTPEALWVVHDFLSEQRRQIDVKYDYRYSQLIVVFGRLLREKWIAEDELVGLAEDKMQQILFIATP